jgi:hypothetical protein
VYTDGVTVVPEWAECSYEGVWSFYQEDPEISVDSNKNAFQYVAKYKLGNDRGLFKAGWTDNPDEVTG